MGILIQHLLPVAGLGALCAMSGCMHGSPVATSESGISFEITAASTAITPPGALVIRLLGESGFEREEWVENPKNNDSRKFPGVPYGHLTIDIDGLNKEVRTLYGHSEFNIQSPNFNANVFLRNIIGTQYISIDQEQQFRQLLTERSTFWNLLPPSSTVFCIAPGGLQILRSTIASSATHLYFLFEINDTLFTNQDRATNGMGEFVNDAVIVYLCRTPPHALNKDMASNPIVRFQCEAGKAVPESGIFDFVNFASGETRNNIIQTFINPDINARLLRFDLNLRQQRILEVGIKKGLIGFPGENVDFQQFGIVIRYRNIDGPLIQLCDWQNGQADLNPKNAIESWGYLEISQ